MEEVRALRKNLKRVCALPAAAIVWMFVGMLAWRFEEIGKIFYNSDIAFNAGANVHAIS